jgi:phosphatidylglycerophosphatase A
MNIHKIIASCFGIGHLKGGGTIAAAITSIIWYTVFFYQTSWYLSVATSLCIVGLGIWSGNKVDALWGKDSSKVVIDEVAGMCIALLFVPISVVNVLIALFLFRFFDIVKPLYIRKLEALPKGWGVMMDDVVAGLYANVLLNVFVYQHSIATWLHL